VLTLPLSSEGERNRMSKTNLGVMRQQRIKRLITDRLLNRGECDAPIIRGVVNGAVGGTT
jgi:hypothetical protein